MRYGEWIRRERKRQGLTQRELADQIGATDGYISHLEKELKVPAPEMAMNLAQALAPSPQDEREFLEAVDSVRLERSQRRFRTRAAAARAAQSRSHIPEKGEPLDIGQIAEDLQGDPELAAAYRDLVTAYANPEFRDAVLKTLQGLAESARSSQTLELEKPVMKRYREII